MVVRNRFTRGLRIMLGIRTPYTDYTTGYTGPQAAEAVDRYQFETTLTAITNNYERNAYRNALLTAIQCGMTPQNIKTMATQHLTGTNHNEPQRT